MKQIITAFATIAIFGTALLVNERHRLSGQHESSVSVALRSGSAKVRPANVRAAGRIEGLTQEIELRARMVEQISLVHVEHGQPVSSGEVLVSLDAKRLVSERDLAAALLQESKARRERLENGFRQSEIEEARQSYYAAMAQVAGVEKAYDRALTLRRERAISQQAVDDLYSQLNALRAESAAARAGLETIDAPPREDELLAATAAVQAAESRLKIAQINLDRAEIRAPIDGKVLMVNARVGELTGPESAMPLIVLSDTSRLRVMAEVDEFDALNVEIGQPCEVTCDARTTVIATGRVAEIEPQMHPKRMFGQWVGERNDTFARRIWIDLNACEPLPVGLPIDVHIRAAVSP